jgi:uncharacterized protein with PIN domain
MANVPGPQPDIRFCPVCKAEVHNIPIGEMKTHRVRPDGSVPTHTHSYECRQCGNRFEINQDR